MLQYFHKQNPVHTFLNTQGFNAKKYDWILSYFYNSQCAVKINTRKAYNQNLNVTVSLARIFLENEYLEKQKKEANPSLKTDTIFHFLVFVFLKIC